MKKNLYKILIMPVNFDLYRPFGPPIGKFKIPLKIVNRINKFVDETIKDKKNLVY